MYVRIVMSVVSAMRMKAALDEYIAEVIESGMDHFAEKDNG